MPTTRSDCFSSSSDLSRSVLLRFCFKRASDDTYRKHNKCSVASNVSNMVQLQLNQEEHNPAWLNTPIFVDATVNGRLFASLLLMLFLWHNLSQVFFYFTVQTKQSHYAQPSIYCYFFTGGNARNCIFSVYYHEQQKHPFMGSNQARRIVSRSKGPHFSVCCCLLRSVCHFIYCCWFQQCLSSMRRNKVCKQQ